MYRLIPMKMLAIFPFDRLKSFNFRCIGFQSFLLLVSIFIALPQAFSETPSVIIVKGINFTSTFQPSSDSLHIQVRRKAPNNLTVSSFKFETIDNPLRLVLDLPGLSTHRPERMPVVGSELVKGLRTGQQKDGARIVFDLNSKVSLEKEISADGRELKIKLSREGEVSTLPVSNNGVTTTTIPALVQSETSAPSTTTTLPIRVTVSPPMSPSPTRSPIPTATETLKPGQSKKFDIEISGADMQPEQLLKFSVDKNFLSIEKDDRPIKDVTVVNKSDKPLLLRTEVERVVKPGSPDERYQKTKDLLASPRGFELAPLASRQVRLVLATKRPSSGEEVFRVTIAPLDKVDDGVAIPATVNEVDASLSVIAGLGVIVTVPSVLSEGTVNAKVEDDRAVFISAGTRVVALENCSDCSMRSNECANFPRKLLYPGYTWSVPIKSSGVVSCVLRIGKESNKLILPYGNSEAQ